MITGSFSLFCMSRSIKQTILGCLKTAKHSLIQVVPPGFRGKPVNKPGGYRSRT